MSLLTYSQRIKDHARTKTLTKENQILSDKLAQIESQLEQLKMTITDMAEYDTKLRLSVAMDLVPNEVRQMGIGGLINDDQTDAGPSGLVQTENTLAELERQVQFQKQSFAEIEFYMKQQENVLNHTPSIWPVGGWVSSNFGIRNDPFTGKRVMHKGMDIVAPPGTPIIAAANGKVIFAGVKGGHGKVVEIDHGYGYSTFYGHCQSIRVTYGTKVQRGQTIATVGRTGKTTGYHLHYGVKISGSWVNPRQYILDNYADTD